MMESEEDFANCMKVVEEAKNRVALEDKEEKRRALSSGVKVYIRNFISFPEQKIDENVLFTQIEAKEEDAEITKKRVNKWIFKLFAEAVKRQERADIIDAAEKKRTAEAFEELKELRKKRVEFEEMWENTRDDRVNSWRNFSDVGSSTGTKKRCALSSFLCSFLTPFNQQEDTGREEA